MLPVYRFRPFLNTDPPHLAAIWRGQPPQRGLLQPVTAPLLEYGVFSKMHFDRRGLIVATRDERPVGFVHAGFGPSDDGLSLDTSMGTTHILMVDPAERESTLADELLAAERRVPPRPRRHGPLRRRHQPAQLVLPRPLRRQRNPRRAAVRRALLSGVPAARGYREIDRVRIMQCDLARVRPPVSRELRLIKRTTQVVEKIDPPPKTWWEACVWGSLQRDCFQLVETTTGTVARLGDVLGHAAAVGRLGHEHRGAVRAVRRRPSCAAAATPATCIGEAIRVLRRRGVATIEAQVMATNEAAAAYYAKLGFTEIDHGVVFRKDATLN